MAIRRQAGCASELPVGGREPYIRQAPLFPVAMVVRLAWCVTGAGTFLRETFKVMLEIKERYGARITTFLSEAAEEVLRIYGLEGLLRRISPGGYYEEVVTSGVAGSSCVYAGRLAIGRYSALVVSPATSNTVAKIVAGIADTVVTTAVAQAVKGGVPVVILPCDVQGETVSPCTVHRDECDGCMSCVDVCPWGAIEVVEGLPRINLLRCRGCERCVSACPRGAIRCWERITVRIRDVDRGNIERLRRMEGVYVVTSPGGILEKLAELGVLK